jgi:enoyl-CoA hydratase
LTSEVLRHDDSGIATLTLNRPDKLNALTATMFKELRLHLEDIAADERVQCVILSGRGRAFCAGRDFDSLSAPLVPGEEFFEARTIDLLEELPQPSICKVRGHCFTGGLELALACDLLVAANSAVFADTHGRWGLSPLWGMTVRLPERVGRAIARELMFTGRRVGGEEAARIGLANRCVPDEDLDGVVSQIALEIIANSSGTIRIAKALMASQSGLSREAALHFERERPFGVPTDREERLAEVKRTAK